MVLSSRQLSQDTSSKKQLTLIFLLDRTGGEMSSQSSRVLLGMKKRGMGEGKWNGFGGKVCDGVSFVSFMS